MNYTYYIHMFTFAVVYNSATGNDASNIELMTHVNFRIKRLGYWIIAHFAGVFCFNIESACRELSNKKTIAHRWRAGKQL